MNIGRTRGSLNYTCTIVMCIIVLANLTTGCSLISIENVGTPFPENVPYGQTLREIRIEGNTHTRTWIIESALASQVGEPYTERSARSDYLWLGTLGVFTAINFRTDPVDDGIALTVSVSEASPYLPSISFRINQENGVEIGPAFSSPNLFGTAARASAYARWGGTTNYGLRYWDPWLPGKSWWFGYRLEYTHMERQNELDDFGEKTDDLFLQVKRNLTNQLHPGLRFRYLSVRSDVDGKTLSPENRDNIPALGLFLELDTRNAPYPTSGWYAEVEAFKYGAFGGDADYWQYTGDVRRYFPLPFGPRHSVALYSMATFSTGEVGTDIPIYMDFHIGGTNSVRGWPLDSRVGKNQWLSTAEYWFRLLDDKRLRFWFIRWRMGLQLGVFGDVGTAWNEGTEFGDNFIAGYGAGLRLTIPAAVMFRLDFAYAKNEFGIKFAIGGGEKAVASRQRVR